MEVQDLTPAQWPWPLLLEADPAVAQIKAYIYEATVMGLWDGVRVIAVVVLKRHSETLAEIMNIAVDPAYRGQRWGKFLLAAAIDRARSWGVQTLQVGTSNSGLTQLGFYQKMGFRFQTIERDYFLTHYPQPISEHGIRCCDRLWLTLALGESSLPEEALEQD